jgi:short-subunit dehydrogenase
LVTGASTGLGLALARKLIALPYRLILTARESSLHRFAHEGIHESERVWIRALDVTNAAQRIHVVQDAGERLGGIDVLLNNAGVAYRSVVEHARDFERQEQFDINFHGPLALARLVLPGMRAKRAGRIINVSSVGGMMAMPTMSLYSASKWALEGATESLWYEVLPWNIRVTLVEPGFIRSDSFQHTRATQGSARAAASPGDPYFVHYSAMSQLIERLMNRSSSSPEHVADVILKTMHRRRPPLRVAGTRDANFFYLLRRFLPRRLYHAVLYRGLPGIKTWGQSGEDSADRGGE